MSSRGDFPASNEQPTLTLLVRKNLAIARLVARIPSHPVFGRVFRPVSGKKTILVNILASRALDLRARLCIEFGKAGQLRMPKEE